MTNRWKAINYFVMPIVIIVFIDALVGDYLNAEGFLMLMFLYVFLAAITYGALEGVKYAIKYLKEDK